MADFKLTHEESVDSVMETINRHDVKYVRLIVVDLNGNPRAMIIPEYEMEYALRYGIGFDGSSIDGFAEVNQSDLIANPDPSTLLMPMWETPGIGLMFCYISNPDGSLFAGDPRGLLKTKILDLEEKGYGFNTGPELEYFYITQENGMIAPFGSGGYFDLPPLDPTEDIKMETMMCLEAAGFQLDKIHHEVAEGQQEINFRYSDALKTADNVLLYKLAVKTIAQKHGKLATFMPKPFWGVNGSGCHVHQSMIDLENGSNVFSSGNGGLSEFALHYVGGILKHAKSMSMIVAPLVNSYKRLVPHYEAPVYIAWGYANRSALVRVPQYPEGMDKTARIEYRHPDPSCNPYLAAVAMLSSGMEGVEKKIDPGEPFADNVYHYSASEREAKGVDMLPEHLGEAVDLFSKDPLLPEALGSYLTKSLIKLNIDEFQSYTEHTGKTWHESRPQITPWELQRYLNRC